MLTSLKPVQVRQGDVLITPISARPEEHHIGEVLVEGKRIVLAHGEVTGHAHAIYPDRDIQEGLQFDAPAANDQEYPEPALEPATQYKLKCSPGVYIRTLLREGTYLEVRTRCLLRHEEHQAILLPPGHYIVLRQAEQIDGLWRAVAD